HSSSKGGANRLRVVSIGKPLRGHVTTIEEVARSMILRKVARAKICGQKAEAALSPEVKLPEPITGGIETLQEEELRLVGRPNMCNAPAVDPDFRFCTQPGEPYGFFGGAVGHNISFRHDGRRRGRRRVLVSIRAAPVSRSWSPADTAYGRRSRTECWRGLAVHLEE